MRGNPNYYYIRIGMIMMMTLKVMVTMIITMILMMMLMRMLIKIIMMMITMMIIMVMIVTTLLIYHNRNNLKNTFGKGVEQCSAIVQKNVQH